MPPAISSPPKPQSPIFNLLPNPLVAHLPNGNWIQSTHTSLIFLPCQHRRNMLQQLHNIFHLALYPGMTDLRVHATPEPRSTSFDETSPAKILTVRPVHQRHTRNNNPFAILEDDEEPVNLLHPPDDDETMADNITVPVSNRTGGTNLDPFLHQRVEFPRNIDLQPLMMHSPQNQTAN